MTVQRTVLIDTCNAMINRDVTSDYSANLREVAKIALSALTNGDMANREMQPVAWRHDNGPFAGMALTRSKSVADSWIANGWTVTPLFATPPAMVRQHECVGRKVFPWVEGRVIPAWVRDLAAGPQGCENTFIIAELDADKQSQGWPQFIAAYIDMRLNRYICGNTAENVSDHVLRYLPFDHSEVETHHAE